MIAVKLIVCKCRTCTTELESFKSSMRGANLRPTGLQSATLPLRHTFLISLLTITLALAHTYKKSLRHVPAVWKCQICQMPNAKYLAPYIFLTYITLQGIYCRISLPFNNTHCTIFILYFFNTHFKINSSMLTTILLFHGSSDIFSYLPSVYF